MLVPLSFIVCLCLFSRHRQGRCAWCFKSLAADPALSQFARMVKGLKIHCRQLRAGSNPAADTLPGHRNPPACTACVGATPMNSGAWFRSTDLWVMSPTRKPLRHSAAGATAHRPGPCVHGGQSWHREELPASQAQTPGCLCRRHVVGDMRPRMP